MRKTAEEILAKKANKTLEDINDSEPFYLHQGEVLGAMHEFSSQEVEYAVEKALAMAAEKNIIVSRGRDAVRHIKVAKLMDAMFNANKELYLRLLDEPTFSPAMNQISNMAMEGFEASKSSILSLKEQVLKELKEGV